MYGELVQISLKIFSASQLCSTDYVSVPYVACMLSSDDPSEESKYNILQDAHQILQFSYHGTQCNRLDTFTSCWNLFRETCGPLARGYSQHATLLIEGCKIQETMTRVDCHWQDMLFGYYINASRVTIWPMTNQALRNPVFLESVHSNGKGALKDLETVLSSLTPGIKEIAAICGSQPAMQLWSFLQKLRYMQADALKFMYHMGKELEKPHKFDGAV